ncbi:MAG: IS66 family transposase [Lautropia sp.]|nr:MAG: IS66 family transposase [Pseudomonadota bacterium]MBC6958565.1 IS66 family transposase [Lautropia sp.]MCL4703215.1 IS66 family transposase [Burkholderiaceae bacterium]MCZ2413739.1 IS66 family transposase [Burkholderiales bacterium]MDL1907008.1 IS66 family transposase [Betaproteobacteria bacterium PRO1]
MPGIIGAVIQTNELKGLTEDEVRALAARLIVEVRHKQATIDKLTHEMAVLKRLRFAARSERLGAEQRSLLEEDTDADLQALADEIERLAPPESKQAEDKRAPKRQPLPAHLPRREIRHEPESTSCGCGCELKRIGEDVAEKLDYTPGVFSVERHVRGKWACAKCQTLVQAPVPAQVIDKGIPSAGLLAHVMISKYADHLPLYRQEGIYARSGLAIARSTLAAWVGATGVALAPLVEAMRRDLMGCAVLHADETPVAMLDPGAGKTHRAYLWSYCTTQYDPISAVVFEFADSRAGKHARSFLGHDGQSQASAWRGTLVCDDYGGYKALFAQGLTEAGCLAHARRKFHELWANHKSTLAEEALKLYGRLYEIERELEGLDAQERQRRRQLEARPVADTLHAWLLAQRQRVPDGSATAKAIDYSLTRWAALMRYLDDGTLPPDNNRIENLIRPIALGRSNWLFAGSLRAGKRAAAIMSLVHSAKLNGHEPHAYLKDVLERLPTHPASRLGELLPYRWRPSTSPT